jgi:hypothetical protein
MNDANPFDGLDEFLSGAFENLRRHESILLELQILAKSAAAVLRERDPAFAAIFDECERQARAAADAQNRFQLGLYDGLVARLRSTG